MLKADYPTLHAAECGSKIVVRGSFPLKHDDAELDWYLVEVVLPDDYPSAPPAVQEIGGRIPRTRDRHVNPDGTLCLAVAEELWIKWQGRFDLRSFLAGPVRTFLLCNSLVEQGGAWPHGERSHGAAGICEFYKEALGFGEIGQIRELLRVCARSALKDTGSVRAGSARNCASATGMRLPSCISASRPKCLNAH
jgi:hypothetical protein